MADDLDAEFALFQAEIAAVETEVQPEQQPQLQEQEEKEVSQPNDHQEPAPQPQPAPDLEAELALFEAELASSLQAKPQAELTSELPPPPRPPPTVLPPPPIPPPSVAAKPVIAAGPQVSAPPQPATADADEQQLQQQHHQQQYPTAGGVGTYTAPGVGGYGTAGVNGGGMGGSSGLYTTTAAGVKVPGAAPSVPAAAAPAGKKVALVRAAAGEKWLDPKLAEWPENDFRIFVGNIGNEVTDSMLAQAFQHYSSFQMARVVRDNWKKKSKGYGFVSLGDAIEGAKALREMNNKYIGNRPVQLRRSTWEDRSMTDKKGRTKKRVIQEKDREQEPAQKRQMHTVLHK